MDRKPYDIVHCHFGPNGLRGTMLREIGALRGKVITSFYGYDVSQYVNKNGSHSYAPLFAKGDLFLSLSHVMRRRLIELGCAGDKILVHRLGVDFHKFSRIPYREPSTATVHIATIGRLVQKKGIEYGIRAVANLVQSGLKLKYTIAGDGPLRSSLEKLIQDLGLGSNVNLAGPMQRVQVTQLLAEADVLIAPSITAEDGDQEGTPVVLMEALAAGLPVVSTKHAGIPEVVEDGVTGFVVPEKDVPALAQKLQYLSEHPDLRTRFAHSGRAAARGLFDIQKLNDGLLEIYNGLLSDRSKACGSIEFVRN